MTMSVLRASPATSPLATSSQLSHSRHSTCLPPAPAGTCFRQDGGGQLGRSNSQRASLCAKALLSVAPAGSGRSSSWPATGTPVAVRGRPLGHPENSVGGKGRGNSEGARTTAVPVRGVPARADGFFQTGAHFHSDSDSRKVLSPEERQARVLEVQREIEGEIRQRKQKLQEAALATQLDSELKFGKMLLSQGEDARALAHFDKVVSKSLGTSWQRCEATFQKAQCLDHLGRKDEARELYESLVQFRAPFAHVKRRAAEALWKMDGSDVAAAAGRSRSSTNDAPSMFDDYLHHMYMTGFGSYHPKEKYVETQRERMLMMLVPASVLLMGPLLIGWLVLHH